jgi:hypothetical protein
MKAKDLLVKYSLEFFVIVLGISVSFWLNELAVERTHEQERVKVLQSLHAELGEITLYCNERRDNYSDDVNLLKVLMDDRFEPEQLKSLTTSKSRIEFILTHYRVFEPPMNRYQSVIHAGGLKYVKSEGVNEQLSRLHNTFQRYMQTSVNYERELKQSFLPFMTSEHPTLVLARHQNAIGTEKYATMLHAAIAGDDRFKANMHLLSGYLENKLYFLKLYEGIVMELKTELENALGDAAPVTTSQERSRLR